ncbi:MAG: MarR family transcriptional regulator [Sulfuricurvum sp.]|uniref:MarR family winged helix-turn-helix transcriptional regulator n=1 Tax=Sulfuricurvum sp. TaxID=2025608 RepID=UPI002611A4AD|nr:MarR family transcriptional regulator [Sulfuricurvum sp.]MDD2829580.1 MarR family transcriptional regulator [Sulfuricurvum sp.]MDD4950373.1 MarR family transcriptional regulator [Sulfuricurvum sp.]
MKKLPDYEHTITTALSTWVEMMKAFNRIRSLELTLIEENGLTIGQFSLLELLYHRGEQSIGAATVLAMSTPGNMTVVVKNLSKRGLIMSHKNPNDKRSSILKITDEGKRIMESLFPEHSRRIQTFMSGLSTDEQNETQKLLRKLNKSLRGVHHV